MIDLFQLCKRYHLPFLQVVEVGVNHPTLAQVQPFLKSRRLKKAVLIEPLARHAILLQEELGKDPRVRVICAAICDVNGPVVLYDLDQSSFLAGLPSSPAIANGYFRGQSEPTLQVTGITFDEIDDGHIDVLAADVEGAEWLILKHLRSRPALICLETHLTGQPYLNPYRAQIARWMRAKGYTKIEQDRTDTVWLKQPARLLGNRSADSRAAAQSCAAALSPLPRTSQPP